LDSNFLENRYQSLDAVRRKAVHDLAVHLLDGAIEGIYQIESVTRKPMDHRAAIRITPNADQQATLFKTVRQARDIGVARDQTGADLLGTEPVGGTSNDAEDVVLRWRKAVRLEETGDVLHEEVGGMNDVEGRLLLEAPAPFGRPARVLRLARHETILFVGNDYNQMRMGLPLQ
jgi:hypothetical protein